MYGTDHWPDKAKGTPATRPDTREAHKIRYTAAEWAAIVEQARTCNRPPAQYVRERSLGHTPRSTLNQQNAVIHQLGKIGTALTRLAGQAREAGALPETAMLEAALDDVLSVVRRLG